MLVAAEHPLVMELTKGKTVEKDVQEFVEKVKKQDKLMRTLDKTLLSLEVSIGKPHLYVKEILTTKCRVLL
jgi:ribosomal protein L1